MSHLPILPRSRHRRNHGPALPRPGVPAPRWPAGLAVLLAPGSVIAMAGDRIVMQPHSQMMIHDAAGMCIGNA
ncbi:hypothetical protein, partial [Streptosporangium sp. NPDC003464]